MDAPRPSVWGPQPEFDMGVGNFVIARLRLKAVSVWRACTARLKACLSNSGCGSKLYTVWSSKKCANETRLKGRAYTERDREN
jgi:hypothetical protein